MIKTIGVPKEIKSQEGRVGLRPQDVKKLVEQNYKVLVEVDAGLKSGFYTNDYKNVGATILNSREKIYKQSDIIVKVKEPQPSEYSFLQEDQKIFCYFHFASSKKLTKAIKKSKCIPIPYETLQVPGSNSLPLLEPMSEIAGRLSALKAAELLSSTNENIGLLISGTTGVKPAKVLIIGGGIVGENAAKISSGMGAEVVILDTNIDRIKYLNNILNNVKCYYSDDYTLIEEIHSADVIIGAVHSKGAKTNTIITNQMSSMIKQNAVFIDVSIDQGGCAEFSKPTTHNNPTYMYNNILCYCVANMPGSVPKTSINALCNRTFPVLQEILGATYIFNNKCVNIDVYGTELIKYTY